MNILVLVLSGEKNITVTFTKKNSLADLADSFPSGTKVVELITEEEISRRAVTSVNFSYLNALLNIGDFDHTMRKLLEEVYERAGNSHLVKTPM